VTRLRIWFARVRALIRPAALDRDLQQVIACVNIAGLFAADALGRQREFGVRFALGGVRVLDARVVALTIALLALVTTLAVYRPTSRAMRLSPMEALRHDEP
jgi:ABC-type antimicrobial peptide transport system permease subunit